jgi:hypothetical protein
LRGACPARYMAETKEWSREKIVRKQRPKLQLDAKQEKKREKKEKREWREGKGGREKKRAAKMRSRRQRRTKEQIK